MTSGQIDVDAARAATPGCHNRAFLLSAGSSLPTTETLTAVVDHLRLEADIGGYAAADRAVDVLEQGRADLATLIGAHPGDVALVPSDSVAWVKAWWGWVAGGNVPRGSVVLIDRMTYSSHYAALDQTSAFTGFALRVMPSLDDGTVDLAALTIDSDVTVVCVTVIGTHSGNVNAVAAIGALAATAGTPMFVDACQAVGQLELDVTAAGCHVLTGTGRKFLRGPRGTGLLWIDPSIVDRFQPPGIDATSTSWTTAGGMHIDAAVRRFEEYEVPYAAYVGLAAAARQAVAIGITAIEQRVVAAGEQLRGELASLPGVTVRDTAARRCAIVTFTVDGVPVEEVVDAASGAGVVVNSSSAVWAALDMEAKRTPLVVRASPHYFNTDDDLARLAEVVRLLPRR